MAYLQFFLYRITQITFIFLAVKDVTCNQESFIFIEYLEEKCATFNISLVLFTNVDFLI